MRRSPFVVLHITFLLPFRAVPNTSHAILLEAADVVAAAVCEFLAGVRSHAPRLRPSEPRSALL